jgi:hypothetical protein
MRLERIPRREWLDERFAFSPGQHLNIISSTGAGKSYLLWQSIEKIHEWHPELHIASLMPKPADSTTLTWMNKLGFKKTEKWPPRKHNEDHVFWPVHIRNDEAANKIHLASQFKNALNDLYWQGDSVTFVDDAYLLGVIYGLNPELDRHWIAGRANNASLITSLQKPSGTTGGAISSFAYNAPSHMLFGKDSDERNLKRISEIAISELDPEEIAYNVKHLPTQKIGNSTVSDFIHIDRSGPYICQVGIT